MLEWLANPGGFAWPLALTCTTLAVADRIRLGIATGRRRELLNRALHELRRPLQALALSSGPDAGGGQLGRAIAALSELDRAVNGGEGVPRSELVDARELAEQAIGRWREEAARRGRSLQLRWLAGGSVVVCDPDAVARALDNLLANALEHGLGPVRLEGAARSGSLRFMVVDGADAGSVDPRAMAPGRLRADPRRGHGLRLVAEVAAAHGGRFAACRHAAGASAVLELPLVDKARGRRRA